MDEFTEEEGAALMNGPIPGESLTQDPANPQPYETSPDYTKLEDFIDDLFLNITAEDNINGILDPMRKGIPLEDIAQMLLFQAFSSGKISTDLVLAAVEPTVYMMIGLAEYGGVAHPVLYPEDDMLVDEGEEITALEQAAMGTEAPTISKLPTPKGVSKSLVSKLKAGGVK